MSYDTSEKTVPISINPPCQNVVEINLNGQNNAKATTSDNDYASG
jgi:hypothetical protein